MLVGIFLRGKFLSRPLPAFAFGLEVDGSAVHLAGVVDLNAVALKFAGNVKSDGVVGNLAVLDGDVPARAADGAREGAAVNLEIHSHFAGLATAAFYFRGPFAGDVGGESADCQGEGKKSKSKFHGVRVLMSIS